MTFKELLSIAKRDLEDLTEVEHPDFRLEQAVYNEDARQWELVVSFLVHNVHRRNNPLSGTPLGLDYTRIFKSVHINAEGEMEGFYMYNQRA